MNRRPLILTALAAAIPWGALAQIAPSANSDLVVAQIGPFTVLPAPDPKELNEGIRAALAEVNAAGGIQGRTVRLLTLDDTYTYEGFKAQLTKALDARAVALLTPLGSATLKAMLDDKLLDSTDTVVINAVPGAQVLREPGHPKLFHIRAGDEQQIRKIVAHARMLNIQSMGVLHQNIPMGTSGLASAQAAAKAEGGNFEVTGFPSSTDAAAITAAAQALAKAAPHSALVVGAPKFSGEAIAALRKAGVVQQIFTLSYLPAPALARFAGQGARGVGIAQTFPNPAGVSLRLQRDFRSAMKKTHPDMTVYSTFHMEGYITARVFAAAARRARSLTPAGIAQALQSMGELDLNGFRTNFSKNNEGSGWVDIGVTTADGKLIY